MNITEIRNINNISPNILYFLGESFLRYGNCNFLNILLNQHMYIDIPSNITYISIGHNSKTLLSYLLKNKNIKVELNELPTDVSLNDYSLNETYKKAFNDILEELKKVSTEYTIISYDSNVIIQSFDDILNKFNLTGLDILYTASKVNKPNITIDIINNRDWRGDFRYFCPNCCIGKTKKLILFYLECIEFILVLKVFNYFYVIRKIFLENIISKNILIDFDYECNIFLNFNKSMLKRKKENNKTIYIVY